MSLLTLLVWLLVLVAIAGIVYFVLQQVPLPQPLRLAVIVIVAIIAIVILLEIATGLTGTSVLRL